MKATQSIVLKRIELISTLLIKGDSRESIVQNTSKKWQVSSRQIDTYISKAKIAIEKSVSRNVSYDYAKAIRRYEDLYKLNLQRKDYKTALAANKELAALQGLFKTQIEHSGEVKFICNLP